MHGSGRIGRELIDAADRPFGKGGIKRNASLGGEGDDFLHGRQQHATGFGNGAENASGLANDGAHGAERLDMHELLPQGNLNVVRHDGGHAGCRSEGGANTLDSPGLLAAHLTELDSGFKANVPDGYGAGLRSEDLAEPAEDDFRTERFREQSGGLEAVLHRDDDRVRSHERSERGCDSLDLVSFDRYKDDIAAADLRRVARDIRIPNLEVSGNALNPQPLCPKGRKSLSASEKNDIETGLRQPSSKVAPNGPHSNHGDSHGIYCREPDRPAFLAA